MSRTYFPDVNDMTQCLLLFGIYKSDVLNIVYFLKVI